MNPPNHGTTRHKMYDHLKLFSASSDELRAREQNGGDSIPSKP